MWGRRFLKMGQKPTGREVERVQITELFHPGSIAIGEEAVSYEAAIHTMVGLMDAGNTLNDAAAYERDVLSREREGSTCVGNGVGIPHAKSSAVAALGLSAITLAEPGLPCHDAPGGPVRLMFLIAAPDSDAGGELLHIQVLAQLAGLLLDMDFCDALCAAATPEAFLALIAAREGEQAAAAPSAPPPPERPQTPEPASNTAQPPPAKPLPPDEPRPFHLLAVTACPAGLAHTYLAAAALKSAAEKAGISIKVETNGASGVQNELTAADIAAADCIIAATDKSVAMDRFIGKPVLEVGTGSAVRSAAGLVSKALRGRVPVYEGMLGHRSAQHRLKSLVPDFYRHLMNGISHMLPFVTGGGILVALSLLLDRLGAPASICALLFRLGDTALQLIYPILSGYIASSIGVLSALMPGVLGGFLAMNGMTIADSYQWVPSGFWGALLAGGLAGMTLRLLRRLGKKVPDDLDHLKTALLYPVVGLLVVGIAMMAVINPPMGQFNLWLDQIFDSLHGTSRVLLCLVMAGLMATDYGGPLNKAAYLSGTLALLGGQDDIMAAVMLGGMVPPIGVALACWLFPHKFSVSEHHTIPQNLLLGASFITEGALPFALKDPLRIIPASCLGSAVAGGISILLDCGCPAPHGGLFLLPVLTNPVGFIVALAAGSFVMALLVGVTKPSLSRLAPDPAPDPERPTD